MSRKARRNYINAISQRVDRKKMYKAKKQWIVAGISFLVATGMGTIASHVTPIHASSTQQNNPTKVQDQANQLHDRILANNAIHSKSVTTNSNQGRVANNNNVIDQTRQTNNTVNNNQNDQQNSVASNVAIKPASAINNTSNKASFSNVNNPVTTNNQSQSTQSNSVATSPSASTTTINPVHTESSAEHVGGHILGESDDSDPSDDDDNNNSSSDTNWQSNASGSLRNANWSWDANSHTMTFSNGTILNPSDTSSAINHSDDDGSDVNATSSVVFNNIDTYSAAPTNSLVISDSSLTNVSIQTSMKVSGTAQGMFANNSDLQNISGLDSLDMTNVSNVSDMFSGDSNLNASNTISAINKWRFSPSLNFSIASPNANSIFDIFDGSNLNTSGSDNQVQPPLFYKYSDGTYGFDPNQRHIATYKKMESSDEDSTSSDNGTNYSTIKGINADLKSSSDGLDLTLSGNFANYHGGSIRSFMNVGQTASDPNAGVFNNIHNVTFDNNPSDSSEDGSDNQTSDGITNLTTMSHMFSDIPLTEITISDDNGGNSDGNPAGPFRNVTNYSDAFKGTSLLYSLTPQSNSSKIINSDATNLNGVFADQVGPNGSKQVPASQINTAINNLKFNTPNVSIKGIVNNDGLSSNDTPYLMQSGSKWILTTKNLQDEAKNKNSGSNNNNNNKEKNVPSYIRNLPQGVKGTLSNNNDTLTLSGNFSNAVSSMGSDFELLSSDHNDQISNGKSLNNIKHIILTNATNVSDTQGWFKGLKNLQTFTFTHTIDMSDNSSMIDMFADDSDLTTVNGLNNLRFTNSGIMPSSTNNPNNTPEFTTNFEGSTTSDDAMFQNDHNVTTPQINSTGTVNIYPYNQSATVDGFDKSKRVRYVPKNRQVTDHIDFNGDPSADTTVQGSDGTPYIVSPPNGYYFVTDNPNNRTSIQITLNGGTHNFNVESSTHTIHISFNGDSKANYNLQRTMDNPSDTWSDFDSDINAPSGYHFTDGKSTEPISFTNDNKQYTFNVAQNKMDTDTITFNGDSKANTTMKGADQAQGTVNAPQNYHFIKGSNGEFTYNGGSHTFNVDSDMHTVHIHFNGDSSANTDKQGNYQNTDVSINAPANYHFTDGKSTESISFSDANKGHTYNFNVAKNAQNAKIDHDRIYFKYGQDLINTTPFIISGQDGQNYTLPSNDVPQKYALSNDGTQSFKYNNGVHYVDVKYTGNNNIPVEGNPVKFNGNLLLQFHDHDQIIKDITIPYSINTRVNEKINNLLKNGNPSVAIPADYLHQIIQNFNTKNFTYDNNVQAKNYDGIYVSPNEGTNASGNTYNNPQITLTFSANKMPETIHFMYHNHNEGNMTLDGANDTQGNVTSANVSNLNNGWSLANKNNTFIFGNGGSDASGTYNDSDNVAVVPDSANATIKYQVSDPNASNNGSVIASDTLSGNDAQAYDAGNTSNTINSSNDPKLPNGYQLVSANSVVPYDNGTHYIKIIGTMHNPNGKDLAPTSTKPSTASDQSDIIQVNEKEYDHHNYTGTKTQYIAVKGRTGERFTLNANNFIPSNYTPTIDQSVSGIFNANGVPTKDKSISFDYNVLNGQTVSVTYINQHNKTLKTGTVNGAKNSTGNILDKVGMPAGYSLTSVTDNGQNISGASNTNIPYMITNNGQNVIVRVNGNPVNKDFMLTIYPHGGNRPTMVNIKRIHESGRVGDTFTINPLDYVPTGYHPINDNVYTGYFGNGNLLKSDDATLNTATQFNYQANNQVAHIHYIDQNGNDVTPANNTISGSTNDDLSNVTQQVPIPKGYQDNLYTNYSYQFGASNNPDKTYVVEGNHIDGEVHVNLVYKETNGHVDSTSQVVQEIHGQVGDKSEVQDLTDFIKPGYGAPSISKITTPFTVATAPNGDTDYHKNYTVVYTGQSAGNVTVNYVDDDPKAINKNIGSQQLSNLGTVGQSVNLGALNAHDGNGIHDVLEIPTGYRLVNASNPITLQQGATEVTVGLALGAVKPNKPNKPKKPKKPKKPINPATPNNHNGNNVTPNIPSNVPSDIPDEPIAPSDGGNNNNTNHRRNTKKHTVMPHPNMSDNNVVMSHTRTNNIPATTPTKPQHNRHINTPVHHIAHNIWNGKAKRVFTVRSLNKLSYGKLAKYRGNRLIRIHGSKHYRYFMIIQPVALHKDIRIIINNESGKFLKPHQALTVRINRAFQVHGKHHDYARYEINIHHHNYFVTGNTNYVTNAYLQRTDFRKRAHTIRIIKPCIEYKSLHYTKANKVRVIKRGMKLHVKKIIFLGRRSNYQTRLLLTNGNYVTANKNYVKII